MKRQAMKLPARQKAAPPRNPYVVAALFKKAGSHRKPGKALRRSETMTDQRAARASVHDRSQDCPSCLPEHASKHRQKRVGAFVGALNALLFNAA